MKQGKLIVGNIILFIVIAVMTIPFTALCDSPPSAVTAPTHQDLPFYEAIRNIIDPLEYSGFPVMVKPQVNLNIDFGKRTWTLANIHEYDANGVVILEQGRYGLCAELATYVYAKLKPILNPRFGVKFAMATESGFPADNSNHIVLLMVDGILHEAYLIDPSFHKYAKLKDLPEYHVTDIQDTLGFIKDQSHDVSFFADQATPLYVKGDFLLSFAVISVDGKFDKNNFRFVVSANRRYKFWGRDILTVGRHNGQLEDSEDKVLLQQLLSEDQIKTIEGKFHNWLQAIK